MLWIIGGVVLLAMVAYCALRVASDADDQAYGDLQYLSEEELAARMRYGERPVDIHDILQRQCEGFPDRLQSCGRGGEPVAESADLRPVSPV